MIFTLRKINHKISHHNKQKELTFIIKMSLEQIQTD